MLLVTNQQQLHQLMNKLKLMSKLSPLLKNLNKLYQLLNFNLILTKVNLNCNFLM